LSSGTITRRRSSKAATILCASSCGPSSAAMPAYCVGALTQEWQLTARRTTCSTSAFGHTEKPSRQPVMA
jgi:hypothetical protein